ncbi:MAG: AraC family transcriptional regulator [Gammaproteobacteria bacterium]|nr:AraC family transcriptional regulator [Gammaproteobacteria bacterium]
MTFADIATALSVTILAIKENMLLPALIIAFLWCINVVNWMNNNFLRILGVYPRHWAGIPGIFFSPVIHANADHLFFNSVPLFILMAFLLAMVGQSDFIQISLWIIIASGILTWLVGRKAVHVGASGVIMGYWTFILAYTWHHPSLSAVIMSAIMLYYLAGLALSLLPTSERVSWEGHCCGAVAGIIVAYFL